MADLDGPRWGPREAPVRQLVVLCHGVGADGHDLIDLAPHWAAALPQAAFAAPDAPEPYDMAPMGRQWFSLSDRSPARMQAGVAAAAAALGRFVETELARLGLPADAYTLMGFSQGAMTVLQAGLHGWRGRVAPPRAVLAFSGGLIDPTLPPGPLPPVLLVHGEADAVVPPERSHQAESALLAVGASVQALYAPRLGHGIDEAGLSTGALFLQRAFA